jgi:hypothetical protein
VVHDWTVQDLVAHLTATDELLVAQLGSADDETFEAMPSVGLTS